MACARRCTTACALTAAPWLSLPPSRDIHTSPILTSYRVRQGVLHNPRSDRRTTQGIFHVTEGGLPIPDDKKAVPVAVFGRLLAKALQPPPELLALPFTAADAAAGLGELPTRRLSAPDQIEYLVNHCEASVGIVEDGRLGCDPLACTWRPKGEAGPLVALVLSQPQCPSSIL